MFSIIENMDGTLSLCYGDSVIVKDICIDADIYDIAVSLAYNL